MCKNGDVLASPALCFGLLDLASAVDQQRQMKQANEQPDDDNSVDIKLEIKVNHFIFLVTIQMFSFEVFKIQLVVLNE